jgi:drug/metabolite transporter (DMT)-like permease
VFGLTLAFGLAVVIAISLSPLYAVRLERLRSRRIGAALVIASFGLVFVSLAHHRHPDGRALFLAAFACLLVGAVLVLADDGADDDGGGETEEPPWWPEFESGFRRYASRPRQPV